MTEATKIRLLRECIEPKRYNQLRSILGIKDPAVLKHIKDLSSLGYLEKTDEGSYHTTEDGIRLLEIASQPDNVGKAIQDEVIFEQITKKLKLAKGTLGVGHHSTPLQRLVNTYPSLIGADKVVIKQEQIPKLRQVMFELLKGFQFDIQGVDLDRLSEQQKLKIIDNMLDSFGVLMSRYKGKEMIDKKYHLSMTIDVSNVSEENKTLVSNALFWIFKYKPILR